jgi:hypothetical protein
MMRFVKVFLVGLGLGVFGAGAAIFALAVGLFAVTRQPTVDRNLPDGPTLVETVREVARLETLDVRTYKKLTYAVDPPKSESVIGAVVNWATYTADPPVGRAMVFADVHIGLDLSRIDADSIRVQDDVVTIVLPPLASSVELRPGEMEVVASNLDSAQTAELLERAKWAIQRDVDGDPELAARARESAIRALTNLMLSTGFREVIFVDELGPMPEPSPAPAT